MHTVTAHGGGELIATLQSIPRLRSRLSALPPPLRSAALQTRLSALPSLPCISVRLFSGRMRGRHMRPRARARRCCRRGTQAHTSSGCAGQARAMGAHRGPTIGATRGASAVAMAVETCLLASVEIYRDKSEFRRHRSASKISRGSRIPSLHVTTFGFLLMWTDVDHSSQRSLSPRG